MYIHMYIYIYIRLYTHLYLFLIQVRPPRLIYLTLGTSSLFLEHTVAVPEYPSTYKEGYAYCVDIRGIRNIPRTFNKGDSVPISIEGNVSFSYMYTQLYMYMYINKLSGSVQYTSKVWSILNNLDISRGKMSMPREDVLQYEALRVHPARYSYTLTYRSKPG